MSFVQSVSRNVIADLVIHKRPFKLRLENRGITVEADYDKSIHSIDEGDFITAMPNNNNWIDIGQVDHIFGRDVRGLKRFRVKLVPRLNAVVQIYTITIPSTDIKCCLKVVSVKV